MPTEDNTTFGDFKYIRDRETALAAPDSEMRVETIIPDGKLVIPWGDTGCGKTYWMVELVTAVPMRRPAFGKFEVLKEGDSGLGVIFAGEDCDYLEKSRLVAIERAHDRSLQGLVYTVYDAMPVAGEGSERELRKAYVNELKRLQDRTGKAIDIIGNDTLKQSLGSLKQNEDAAARQFNGVMAEIAGEFECAVICNAHQPKSGEGGVIAGSGDFTANCPVTPHLTGIVNSRRQLQAIDCEFWPKYRLGLRWPPIVRQPEPSSKV